VEKYACHTVECMPRQLALIRKLNYARSGVRPSEHVCTLRHLPHHGPRHASAPSTGAHTIEECTSDSLKFKNGSSSSGEQRKVLLSHLHALCSSTRYSTTKPCHERALMSLVDLHKKNSSLKKGRHKLLLLILGNISNSTAAAAALVVSK
jgi:hypothetical protein